MGISKSENSFIVLIRGINVGGKNKVKMEALRAACEAAGLHNVATFIQSGNVVFRSDKDAEALRKIFVKILEKEFSVKTEVVVIGAAAYRAIAKHFPEAFAAHPDWKHDVFFLESVEEAKAITKEFGGQADGLIISSYGQAVYWSRDREDGTPDKQIRKLLAHPAYKRMTIRNNRTTEKLLGLLS
jgi:uncharacterized protein (DUF1697 family)